MTAVLQSYIAGRWHGSQARAATAQRHQRQAGGEHARRNARLRRGAAPRAHGGPAQPAEARLPAARGDPEGAGQVPQRQQGSAVRRVGAHRRHAAGRLDRHRGRQRHAVRVLQRRQQRAALGQRGARGARACRSARRARFAGTHILVPRRGVAVHINAFNFPVWGLLEKFAPTFLAGMPCIGKPATATSYLTEALVRSIHAVRPAARRRAAAGDRRHRRPARPARRATTWSPSPAAPTPLPSCACTPTSCSTSIPFNAEADSLNCAILAPDVAPDDEEFDLFVREVAREMTVKAGQKCTAIRRAIVPQQHVNVVAERCAARLAKTVVGDPAQRERAHGRAGVARAAQRRDRARGRAEPQRRGGVRRARRLCAGGRRRGRRRVLRAHAAAGPRCR